MSSSSSSSSSRSMEMEKKERESEALQEAQVWKHIYSFAESQALRCAIQLHIPDIIHSHNHPNPITISQLASHIPAPCSTQNLHRLMLFLTQMGLFKQVADAAEEDAFELTPLSALLVRETKNNLIPMVTVGFDVLMVPWHHMVRSLEENGAGVSDAVFKRLYGVEFWEYAEKNAEFGERLNEAMACDSRLTMPAMIEQCREVFEGVESLVDVGGGTGTGARAIAEAFPHVRCTVFDHPHVVEAAPECVGVGRVAGDMFVSIPPADALLLKWILHNYGDEECIRILKRCKEALPNKGGKVIIVDTVMDDDDDDGTRDEFTSARHALDLEMMLLFGGKERTREEWRRLLQHVGFNKCKIMPIKSTIHSLIEAYL